MFVPFITLGWLQSISKDKIKNYDGLFYYHSKLQYKRTLTLMLSIDIRYKEFKYHNGSVNAVRLLYPEAILLPQISNLAYSKANNLGIKSAKGRYVLLLNSDTMMRQGCLITMLDSMDSNLDIGATSCKVVLQDGSLDKACKRSFPSPVNALYHYLGLPKLFPSNRNSERII